MDKESAGLIAYCGLYCGDCPNHTGRIADLARDLRKELRQIRFDKTAEFMSTFSFFKVFERYTDCYEVLGAMVKFRCKRACRGGGGPPFCKMRKCCEKKAIEGCWECAEFETCNKLDFLKPSHGVAHIENLKKIRKQGAEEFVKGKKLWYKEG
ncbi:MAG: DUF3795 domain-containing protein [Bacillota bacterium]